MNCIVDSVHGEINVDLKQKIRIIIQFKHFRNLDFSLRIWNLEYREYYEKGTLAKESLIGVNFWAQNGWEWVVCIKLFPDKFSLEQRGQMPTIIKYPGIKNSDV